MSASLVITDWTTKAIASQHRLSAAMICTQQAISDNDPRGIAEALGKCAEAARETADALTVAAAIAGTLF